MQDLQDLATKADVERQTRKLIVWLVAVQFALFVALILFLGGLF